jgi:hypothetical protein
MLYGSNKDCFWPKATIFGRPKYPLATDTARIMDKEGSPADLSDVKHNIYTLLVRKLDEAGNHVLVEQGVTAAQRFKPSFRRSSQARVPQLATAVLSTDCLLAAQDALGSQDASCPFSEQLQREYVVLVSTERAKH